MPIELPRDPSSEDIETHGVRAEKHRVGYAGAGGTVVSDSRGGVEVSPA